MYDYLIIGGGVVGCNIARELSKYKGKTLLLEKECDVALETSGRNSGVSHAGFYQPPGTQKAELNVKGHGMLPNLCSELGVAYKRIGKLVIAQTEEEIEYLEKLEKQGNLNGVEGLEIINREKIKELEPNIEALVALHSPTSAILDPLQLTIGLAENALENGVEIKLNTEVVGINKGEKGFTVKTNNGSFKTRNLINCAGLYADKISRMAGVDKYTLHPCKGEYYILDKRVGQLLNGLVYPVPPKGSGGLGVHITPTVDGNIMLGPSADYIDTPCNVCCTGDVMEQLYTEASEMLPLLTRKDFIRSFAGNRPKINPDGTFADFIIKEEYEGFINLIGIESPRLTAAPAIAEKVVGFIKKRGDLKENKKFNPIREEPVKFSELSHEEQAKLIEEDKDYGEIVCRCETVTRKEVKDALDNPLDARSITSIKNRCRASMGRCQGGFCWPKITEIIEEKEKEVRLNCEGSEMFIGKVKDLRKK